MGGERGEGEGREGGERGSWSVEGGGREEGGGGGMESSEIARRCKW